MKCQGCKASHESTDHLCLSCVEDLNEWLRSVPALWAELAHVRLPGSVRQAGPSVQVSGGGSKPPVRVAALDLEHPSSGTLAILESWCAVVWESLGGSSTGRDVDGLCGYLRHRLLAISALEWAAEFYHALRALYRELAAVVGEPEVKPVGKCPKPDDAGELCRGPLYAIASGVICKRCGTMTGLKEPETWVTQHAAATIVGKPIETIRTWRKRKQVRSEGLMLWLPDVVARASTTLPHTSDTLNLSSGAKLSVTHPPQSQEWDQAAATKTSAPELSKQGAVPSRPGVENLAVDPVRPLNSGELMVPGSSHEPPPDDGSVAL